MLALERVEIRYPQAAQLQFPTVRLNAGEHCLLLGPSGCGKTTLLHVAAGLLTPDSGSVRLGETEVTALTGAQLDRFRGRHIGIVFQRLHLIPSLTVLENLTAAQYCAGLPTDEPAARGALARVGVEHKASALPAQLSQGQAQRVAIARAIVNRPQLILTDEPTSSLDDANARLVLELLQAQAQECNAVLLVATHDARAKSAIERRIDLGTGA
ncbi:MAG: ABC transporter ATP-binding protein [Nevskia sp.]|nr:ABC transporter ATP-binding protein [Nevskia sp.]